MKRWHEDRKKMLTNRQLGCIMHTGAANLSIGYFRKSKALDCGNPKCYMCHGDKHPVRIKTTGEKIADLKLKEYIDERKNN